MGGVTCEHEWVSKMRQTERGQQVFHSGVSHFENAPNFKRRHKDVMYRVCSKCGQVGFRYYHSRVMYTWSQDKKEPGAA